MKRLLALLPVSMLPVLSMAHPHHGHTDGYTIIHYISEPIHAFSLLLVALAAVVLTKEFRKQKA